MARALALPTEARIRAQDALHEVILLSPYWTEAAAQFHHSQQVRPQTEQLTFADRAGWHCLCCCLVRS